jgi:2-iminobutanoate/2-iminopropanoate deaminase
MVKNCIKTQFSNYHFLRFGSGATITAMSIKQVVTENAPKAIGPYSQAIAFKDLLFISGQIPIDPCVGKIVDHTIEGQARQVLANIEAILESEKLTFEHVVKVEVFVMNLDDFPVVNGIYGEKFSFAVKPARQLVQVARLPLDSLIEISCIAVRS